MIPNPNRKISYINMDRNFILVIPLNYKYERRECWRQKRSTSNIKRNKESFEFCSSMKKVSGHFFSFLCPLSHVSHPSLPPLFLLLSSFFLSLFLLSFSPSFFFFLSFFVFFSKFPIPLTATRDSRTMHLHNKRVWCVRRVVKKVKKVKKVVKKHIHLDRRNKHTHTENNSKVR